MRLVGGSDRCSGRVEVYHNNSWGTVCDDNWDLEDAEVVCRELGCVTAQSAPRGAHFGPGNDPIWMNDVRCSGSEWSLTQCPHRGFGEHNCGHGEDAGVVCTGKIGGCVSLSLITNKCLYIKHNVDANLFLSVLRSYIWLCLFACMYVCMSHTWLISQASRYFTILSEIN